MNVSVIGQYIAVMALGVLYWFCSPPPRKTATYLAFGFPILTLTISGVAPVLRVSQRVDDGNLKARVVQGYGIELT